MDDKIKQKLEGLTEEEMKTHDDFKSLFIYQNLTNIIENESRDITYNFIVSQIQSVAHSDLANRSIVAQVNHKVKQRVTGEFVQEAKEDSDPGVKYIVDYHGLLDETFHSRWKEVERSSFEEAKIQYFRECEKTVKSIIDALNYLL
jgi:hypothetical protein